MRARSVLSVFAFFVVGVAFALAPASHEATASIDPDSIVRITSGSGRAEHVKMSFDLPVAPDWKVLAQTGEGLKAGCAWLPVGDGKTVPWYALLHDGKKTYGFGVKVQPRAMCAWRVSQGKVELLLDVRAGGQPLELGGRTLDACEVVRCESTQGESAYALGRRLCAMMCPSPRLLKEPMIGFNDWYAAYGRNTATNFLADAAFIVSLCKGAAVQPYVVMDDGWQKFSPPEVERLTGTFASGYGPWDESSQSFGMDMKTFCAKIAALGAKPGLWYRPLCMEGKMCDPSAPDVLARIRADMQRFKAWGFKFVKIDYLTFDWCGHFKGFDADGRLIRDSRRWNETKLTTAEIIANLYRTMRDAAGDDMVILGCNAVNHLCAGLFEASRVGPDTSGRDWEQTKRNGVGAVAFKGIENGTFFAADPDCAGLAAEGAIPWNRNRLWIDLLSRSGMPFFISWRRTLADADVRDTLSAAFRRAAIARQTAEAQDWLETPIPRRWLTADGFVEYCWTAQTARVTANFNDGWEFSRDKVEWRAVDVPHDWAIEGPFDPDGDPHTGRLPWKGVGWYRKHMVLDAAPKGRRVFLDFDGVMCDGTAFVNDQPCGRQMYGYLGFRADATPYLYKGTNTIIVKADTTKLASRWYPGAGMYRRVRKIETDDLYLDERDIAITTPDVSAERATVRVKGAVTSRMDADATVTVSVTVKKPSGEVTATGRADVSVRCCGKGAFDIALVVDKPVLWEMVCPAALYTTEVSVVSGGKEDTVAFKTGFRTFRFDAKEGFFLNGRHAQLKGVCLHADLGILGMAYNRSAMRRQLAIMRDMGVNALRTSHNPPSPETLELCDEMGIFVWNECFDKWNATCGRGDEPLEEFVDARLAEFVRRDRNHPCVFVWSIGNEIPNGGGFAPGQEVWNMPSTLGTTAERCARFRNIVLAEDATRPVGIGSCFPKAATEGHYSSLDITGWNYKQLYDEMHRRYPEKPLIYSESASAFSDYGYYASTPPTNKTAYSVADLSVDSYDHNSAEWSDIPDREFERMERDRFVAGEFVWTGIDYLGEPSPYVGDKVCGVAISKRDQARSSYFGVCDLLGFPKDRTFLYRAYWNKEAFTLHIVPDHWTFPEREGKTMPIYVYTSADEAELFVNGKSLGRRRKDPAATMANGYYAGMPRYRLIWDDVAYAPGEIKAVAYGSDGKALGEETLRTADAASSVVLVPESDTLPDGGEMLVFVKVALADANGTPVPRDNRRISFAVDGPGEIVSVGNSNPRGYDSFKDTAAHPLHNGRAGLVLRRTGSGKIRLTASAEGLASATKCF